MNANNLIRHYAASWVSDEGAEAARVLMTLVATAVMGSMSANDRSLLVSGICGGGGGCDSCNLGQTPCVWSVPKYQVHMGLHGGRCLWVAGDRQSF